MSSILLSFFEIVPLHTRSTFSSLFFPLLPYLLHLSLFFSLTYNKRCGIEFIRTGLVLSFRIFDPPVQGPILSLE
jgi:hypothetical protein